LTAEEKVASAPIDVLSPEVHELARVGSATNLFEGVMYAGIYGNYIV